jgi:sugar lactone lactonase YvrE
MIADIRCAFETRDTLGETPLWCEKTQTLWWLDIDGCKLHCLQPQSGKHAEYHFDCNFVGSLALRSQGGLLIALDRALHTFDPASGKLHPFVQVESEHQDTRLNDGRCDARGRFWVGSMDNQLSRPSGAFYRIDPDGNVVRMFGDVIVSNTIAMAPDQKTLYFSDTRRYITWAFDLDVEKGRIGNRRIFVDYTSTNERPDGACIDAEGFLWNAMFAGGRVVRHAPDGRLDRTIELPVTNPTCVCFGGPDLRTLYVTTGRKFLSEEQLRNEPLAGALLAIDVDVEGLPEATFGG